MFLLDENIVDDERILLQASGLAVHQVGVDWFRKGAKDEHLLALLRTGRGVTFFTRDRGLYRQEFCHRSYCLAVLEVHSEEVAFHVARILKQPQFRTKALRSGVVARIHAKGVSWYPARHKPETHAPWQ